MNIRPESERYFNFSSWCPIPRSWLKKYSPKSLEVFVAFHYLWTRFNIDGKQPHSSEEIAKICNIPPSTVRYHLRKFSGFIRVIKHIDGTQTFDVLETFFDVVKQEQWLMVDYESLGKFHNRRHNLIMHLYRQKIQHASKKKGYRKTQYPFTSNYLVECFGCCKETAYNALSWLEKRKYLHRNIKHVLLPDGWMTVQTTKANFKKCKRKYGYDFFTLRVDVDTRGMPWCLEREHVV